MVDTEPVEATSTVEMLANDVREPSVAVVEAVAAHEGVDPLDLPPLYDAVDPSALDTLFAPRPDGSVRDGQLSFRFAGYDVTVHTSGEVDLDPRDGPRLL